MAGIVIHAWYLCMYPMKPQKIPRRPRQRILLIHNKRAGNKQIFIRKMFHCQILNMLEVSGCQ